MTRAPFTGRPPFSSFTETVPDSAARFGVMRNCRKNFKVVKTANGLTGRPFVSLKLYAAQNQPGKRHLDRDKDGVACET